MDDFTDPKQKRLGKTEFFKSFQLGHPQKNGDKSRIFGFGMPVDFFSIKGKKHSREQEIFIYKNGLFILLAFYHYHFLIF